MTMAMGEDRERESEDGDISTTAQTDEIHASTDMIIHKGKNQGWDWTWLMRQCYTVKRENKRLRKFMEKHETFDKDTIPDKAWTAHKSKSAKVTMSEMNQRERMIEQGIPTGMMTTMICGTLMNDTTYQTQEGLIEATKDIRYLIGSEETKDGPIWTEKACRIWDIIEEWVKLAWNDRGHVGTITDIAWMLMTYTGVELTQEAKTQQGDPSIKRISGNTRIWQATAKDTARIETNYQPSETKERMTQQTRINDEHPLRR